MPAGRPKGAKTRKPNPKKSGPRFTLTEREGVKAEVQKLDRRGYNQYQIAERLDVSQGTVGSMLAEIRVDYQQAYVDDRKRKAAECEAAHREVIAECWTEIERLREKGKTKRTSKSGSTDKGAYSEDAETVEDGEIGGYLALITQNWQQIFALYGLKDLPAQVFAQITVGGEVGRDEFDRLGEMLLGAMGVKPKQEAVGDLLAVKVVDEGESK